MIEDFDLCELDENEIKTLLVVENETVSQEIQSKLENPMTINDSQLTEDVMTFLIQTMGYKKEYVSQMMNEHGTHDIESLMSKILK